MARATAVPVSGSKLDNRRVLAALIDLAIVGAGYALILALAGQLSEPNASGGVLAVGVGWALYYYFACESGAGQTVGKQVMKIRVVKTDGSPAGMREVSLRTVLRLIDGLFLYLVGLIVVLATRERRGRLGDLVGGTMIVSADKPAPSVDMSAPEMPAAVSRVPIAESGPAFEPVAEPLPAPEADAVEPEVAEVLAAEPEVGEAAQPEAAEMEAAEPEAAEAAQPEASDGAEPSVEAEPDVASPALKELASDVSAVTEDPAREVEPDEDPETEPADQPAAHGEDSDAEEHVTVKSVETVSAIDLVMQDGEGRKA